MQARVVKGILLLMVSSRNMLRAYKWTVVLIGKVGFWGVEFKVVKWVDEVTNPLKIR